MNLLKFSIFCLIFVTVGCTHTDDEFEIIKEYCKETNKPSVKLIYPNKNDTSNFTKIEYYCSTGNICCKYIYQNSILKKRAFWLENGKKTMDEEIIGIKKDSSIVIDAEQTNTITTTEFVGNIKHWNKTGVIIYETKLLPNNREERIYRDSLGVVTKKDTISW